MNRAETVDLLTFCAINDSRTVGETDVIAWHDMLAPIDFGRAIDAARTHYRRQPDVWLKPGHIWHLCKTTTGAPNVIPETGEAFCGTCKGVHQPQESCAVLARPEGFRKAIAGAFRSVADALSPRAVEAPKPTAQEPAMPPKRPLTDVEQRCARQSTAPAAGVHPAACRTCGAAYLDYPDGRDAHAAVFGHNPPAADDTRETA